MPYPNRYRVRVESNFPSTKGAKEWGSGPRFISPQAAPRSSFCTGGGPPQVPVGRCGQRCALHRIRGSTGRADPESWRLRFLIERGGAEAQREIDAAAEAKLAATSEEHRQLIRERALGRSLQSVRPLLQRVSDGTANPLDPELGRLGDLLAEAVWEARAREVGITVAVPESLTVCGEMPSRRATVAILRPEAYKMSTCCSCSLRRGISSSVLLARAAASSGVVQDSPTATVRIAVTRVSSESTLATTPVSPARTRPRTSAGEARALTAITAVPRAVIALTSAELA